MSESKKDQEEEKDPSPGEFAPRDYTDNREEGDWETKYCKQARKEIRLETAYIVLVFLGYLAIVFVALYWSSGTAPSGEVSTKIVSTKSSAPEWMPLTFLGYCCAWAGGGTGGSLFGLKWMYHCVAKRIWHQDRRLWRILMPHISAALSLFMILIVSSGLLKIFDEGVAVRHAEILGFSFLVGYFSDKALAKLAEVADTLFGSGKPAGHKAGSK